METPGIDMIRKLVGFTDVIVAVGLLIEAQPKVIV